jgi:putative hemolysin
MIAMTTLWTVLSWVGVLVACTLIDSMFCGLETGIYRLNRIRLDLRASDGDPAARTLQRMGCKFNNVLAVLLIGTNLCRHVATLAISALFMLAGAGENTPWITMAVATPTMFVLLDSLPKSLFQQHPDALVYRLAWFLRWASRLFNACGVAPLVRGFASGMVRLLGGDPSASNLLGHSGIQTLLAEGEAHGAVTAYQSALAERAMQIGELIVADLTIPMASAACLPVNASRDDAINLLDQGAYAFIPLVDDAGRIVRVMDTYRLLTRPDARPTDTSRDLMSLHDTMSLTEALLQMQQDRSTLAGVVDQAEQTVGIVTLKDIASKLIEAPRKRT